MIVENLRLFEGRWRRLRLRGNRCQKTATFFAHCLLLGSLMASAAQDGAEPIAQARQFHVGVASIDVTPTEPIRLTGYAVRKTNSAGVEQKLWAKAIAIGNDVRGPALLMTLDNCGIAESTYRELVRRLAKHGVTPEQLAICLSHTHAGPCTTDWAPNIFAQDIPADQQATIDRYTKRLIDSLEKVASDALKELKPSQLWWSRGKVEFARNRRTTGGPVDHDLPVLKITRPDGKIRALVANYACHCTTLGGEFNHIHGDWAGAAQAALESEHPGVTALVTIGCGADANPHPRGGKDGGLALANEHGRSIAAEVKRLLAFTFNPLTEALTTRVKEIRLPFDSHFSREQWASRAKEQGIVGYHARKYLARLDRGETLPPDLPYPVVTWHFGNDLGLVFLPGEVVVDYALRLKKELVAEKLWVTGYANYVPCYIPSRRILKEGGYEAESSLWYYDRPGRLAPETEDLIVNTVHELLPKTYRLEEKRGDIPPPRNPDRALRSMRTHTDLEVELVVAEPLVQSPVWIDWSADGRLWVCEMYDYPAGVDGNYQPGGRIKVLSDAEGRGRYETATVFLDGLAFPTGVMPWRKGAFICAAPNILYAEDTDGDGRADLVRTNFTGFATHNYQARVNGLTWGLDGWIYGSSGLFGGKIRSPGTGETVDLSGRDFRFLPETGVMEPAAGLSQQGRIRDDFGNWFGNDNSTLLWHYPLAEHYMRRNTNVIYPEARVNVSAGVPDANRLFPISRTLERYNDPQMADRVTGACGPEIYRDDLLGTNYYGNLFVCEPVHNLVTRRILEPKGATFAARRDAAEQNAEFLASSDNWFRPVQARTGPDGALWIVDMYRFVIEHPRWIPTNRLRELDVRAGADMGRIYRLYRRGNKPREIRDLGRMGNAALAKALDTVNGPTRDLIHQELLARKAVKAPGVWPGEPQSNPGRKIYSVLSSILHSSPIPAARAHALWLGLPQHYRTALQSSNPRLRREGLRLMEYHPLAELDKETQKLSQDEDAAVRFQLALTLGRPKVRFDRTALNHLVTDPDRWMRAALLSSAPTAPLDLLNAVFTAQRPLRGRDQLVNDLLATAFAAPEQLKLDRLILMVVPGSSEALPPSKLADLANLLAVMERRSFPLGYVENAHPALKDKVAQIRRIAMAAKRGVTDQTSSLSARQAALQFYGIKALASPEDMRILAGLLRGGGPDELQKSIVKILRTCDHDAGVDAILDEWQSFPIDTRRQLVPLFAARDTWTVALLKAVERDLVAAAEIPLEVRSQFTAHRDPAVKDLAKKLFGASTEKARASVVAGYKDVASLQPRYGHGADVFDRNCATCHDFRGRGYSVGPNLAEFAGKSVDDFVLAILDPNAAIEPKHVAYTVETHDGRTLMGIVRGETVSGLSLLQPGGVSEQIARSAIRGLRASSVSLMPEGLEQGMSQQEMADLIGWLKQSAPARFGSGTPEQVIRNRTAFVEANARADLRIVRAAETLDYPGWMGRLPLAHCRQTDGKSAVVWSARPMQVSNSVARFRFPVAMGFISQPSGTFSLRIGEQDLVDFNVVLSDTTWERPDGKSRLSYGVIEANSEDSNGVLTLEVAAGLLDAAGGATFTATGSPSASQRWFGIYLP